MTIGGDVSNERTDSDLASPQYWDRRDVAGSRASGSFRGALRRVYHRKFDRMLLHTLSAVPIGARLVEIGCAPGSILMRVDRLRPDLQLAGIDYAPDSLASTREALKKAGVQAALEVADVRTFVPDDKFDAAISCGLVEHFNDPTEIVQGHVRLVRNGGIVVVTVPDFRARATALAFQRLSPDDYAVHNTFAMDPRVLAGVLIDAGLADVRSGVAGGPVLYATPRVRPSGLGRVYLVFARAWNLIAAMLPDALAPWNSYTWATGCVRGDGGQARGADERS